MMKNVAKNRTPHPDPLPQGERVKKEFAKKLHVGQTPAFAEVAVWEIRK